MGRIEIAIELSVSGADEPAAVEAALTALLAAARGPAAPVGAEDATGAVAVRGQGPDLAALVAALANDLLAQLDASGVGLSAVRLDGLLRGDDGYVAWGYLLGDPRLDRPPLPLSLAAPPEIERGGDAVTVTLHLRRD